MDTSAAKVDLAAMEVLLTAANVDHAANEVLLTSVDQKLGDIETAVQGTITVDGTVTANLSATDNAVLDAILVDTSAAKVDLAAMEVLLTGIDADTDAMKVDLAALEVLQTSILAKLTPVKTTQVLFDGVSIADGADSTSSAIDVSTAKHIGFFGFDTAAASTAIDLLACDTSGGTYSGIESGTYQSGVASIGSLNNIPFKFLKIKITNSSGSTNDFTLKAAIST